MEQTNLYSTHLPLIRKLFSIIEKPKLVLEFGMGLYSTEFFIMNSEKTISIEMQSEEWFNNMIDKFKNFKNWEAHKLLGKDTYKEFNFIKPDISFIDGHGETRPECVNLMMDLECPIIIAHDTETYTYGWDRVNTNNGYHSYIFKQYDVWTTLWSKNNEIIKKIQNG